MWQINRLPVDRPDSARHSLQVFLQNDKNPAPTLSLGRAAAVPVGPRARLVIPGAQPAAPSRPITDPRMAPPGYIPPEPVSIEEPVEIPEPPKTTTAPLPLLPPEGSKPSIHTGPDESPSAVTTAYSTATVPLNPTTKVFQTKHFPLPQKPKSGIGFKISMIALVGILLVAVGLFLADRIRKSKGSQRHDVMLADAIKPETAEIPMSGAEFTRFLQDSGNADTDDQRKALFQVLDKARPNDGADFDAATAEFVTKTGEMLPEVREALIREVLTRRINRSMISPLLDYGRQTPHIPTAIAIFEAIRPWVGDDEFESLLSVAQFSKNADLRKAAENSAAVVIKKSSTRSKLLAIVDKALTSADPMSREMLLRLNPANGG